MYAHITTYRLGTSDEALHDMRYAEQTGHVVSDQTARTIASWWHAPGGCPAITSLSHGLPFDTTDLVREVGRDVTDLADRGALLDWAAELEALLADNA